MSERKQELPEGMVDHIVVAGVDGAYRIWFDDMEPDELPIRGLRQFAKYKTWKLDQQTAKVKELRERLRSIEWDDFDDVLGLYHCPICYGIKPDADVASDSFFKADEIGHAPDCWLKAEIDQLEPEEERECQP